MKSDKISVFGPDKDTSGAKQQLLIIHGAVLGAEAERRLMAAIFCFSFKCGPSFETLKTTTFPVFQTIATSPTWQLDFSSDLNSKVSFVQLRKESERERDRESQAALILTRIPQLMSSLNG